MKTAAKLITVLVILSFLLIGCSEDSTNPDSYEFDEEEDNTSIENLLQSETGTTDSFRTYVVNEEDEEEDTLFFYRQITARTINLEIEYTNNHYAEVTRNVLFEGILHIFTPDSVEYEKEFTENAVRYFDLERDPDNHNGFRGWRLVATSGKEYWTDDNEVMIEACHIQTTEVDTVITDISEKILLDNLIELSRNTEVTLTVTTGNNDDLLFIHYHLFQRKPFTNNEDGTYTVTFNTPIFGRFRRFGIDAISHDTLYDFEDGYSSHSWGILYQLSEWQ